MAISLFTLTVLVCSSIGVTTSTSFGHVRSIPPVSSVTIMAWSSARWLHSV